VNNQLTVVFDGQAEFAGGAPQGEIRVIFSEGCSADDQIKRMVEEDLDQKNCVVVSDDKDIFLYARALGARIMGVAAFTSKLKDIPLRQDSDGKYISLSRQEKINKELRGFWLKDKQ